MSQIEGGEKVGILAAEMMETLERAQVEDGYQVRIRTVGVVVELEMDGPDGVGYTRIETRCSDDRRWVQAGFFDAARRRVLDPDPPEEDE